MRYQIGTLSILAALTACDFNSEDDYSPKKDYNAFIAKQKEMAANPAKSVDPAAEAMANATKKYATFCSSCHGTDGKAATPTALALQPKPRAFADKTWQGSVDDAHIAKVIKLGGASVGLSATMTAWGGALSDAEIADIVKVVRKFGQ